MAETVLFDLFGVIAHHQSPEGRNRLLEAAALSCTATGAFWDTYWRLRPRYDQGLIHGSEYWTQVARALDIVLDDRQIAGLAAADIASWSAVDETMVALLGELAAAGHRLALLSNIPEELAAHYELHHSWLQMFQVRGFSCRIGHAKPDPAAFRCCLNALAVPADQVLFVDDRGETSKPRKPSALDATCSPPPHASANSSPLEPSNPIAPRPARWVSQTG